MKRKQPTLNDVAAAAGVSRATASLVVRNSPLVKDSTRKKVLNTMRSIGYVYNRAAASLRSPRTLSLGLVVPDICNPFFAELTLGVEAELENNKYAVFVANTSESKMRQDLILHRFIESQMDGLLVCPGLGTHASDLDWVIQLGIPMVCVTRRIGGISVDYVGADNVTAGQTVANYLLDLGHTDIAFIGGDSDSSARKERISGVMKGLKRQELSIPEKFMPECRTTRADAARTATSLIAHKERPTAIISYNDVVALGVLDAMQRAYMKPGIDMSVIGFDDIDEAATSVPPLTTVAIRPRDIGREATKVLLQRVNGHTESPVVRLLNGSLIIRGTTGPPLK